MVLGLHVAVYAGVPKANAACAIARSVLAEEGLLDEPPEQGGGVSPIERAD